MQTNEPGDTTKMRLVAQDVIRTQAELCASKRENLIDKMITLTATVTANASAITALTASVTALLAVMSHVDSNTDEIDTLKENVTRLKSRPALWNAVALAIPALIGVLLWWFSR